MLADLTDWVPYAWRRPWLALLFCFLIGIFIAVELGVSKAERRGSRVHMKSLLFWRMFTLVLAASMGLLCCIVLADYLSGQRSSSGAIWVVGFLFCAAIAMYFDGLARTVIYDEMGIEARALLALCRKRFIPWRDIQHVRFRFDKIILHTGTSRVVIHGLFRGLDDFKARMKQECPDVEIKEED